MPITHQELFSEESRPALPTGFSFLPSFISLDEEKELIAAIRQISFSNIEMHGVVAKRRAAHFGLRYSYASQRVFEGPPIPAFLLPARERFAKKLNLEVKSFPEALINEYQPGAAIGWHIDGPVYEIIAGLSIAGSCTFKLRPLPREDRPKNGKQKSVSFLQPPRSAYVMTGEGRWNWQHSIPAVKELRYSITFRTLRAPLNQSEKNMFK